MALNPALLKLAQARVWSQAGGPPMEKAAVVPPDPAAMGGAPPMDPMAGGAPPPGAPPMDPMMGGGMPPPGAPPMDPMAAGGMPPPAGAPPMDPMMGGAPPVDPMTGQPAPMAGQKMKPEQYMQMLDYRLYNMQQQMTTLMNSMDIKMDPGILVHPPGAPMGPPMEAAMQGGPQDPGGDANEGEGGGSAISGIEPIQGASPELAMGGGGGGMGGGMGMGEKIGADTSFSSLVEKSAEGKANRSSMEGDVDKEGRSGAPPSKELRGPHPGVRPGTQAISAGGSKQPGTLEDGEKTSAMRFAEELAQPARDPVGSPFEVMQLGTTANNAAAVAAMLRSRTGVGALA